MNSRNLKLQTNKKKKESKIVQHKMSKKHKMVCRFSRPGLVLTDDKVLDLRGTVCRDLYHLPEQPSAGERRGAQCRPLRHSLRVHARLQPLRQRHALLLQELTPPPPPQPTPPPACL